VSWSKKFERCENCHTTRRRHKAHGLCTRCEPLKRKLQNVDSSDLPLRLRELQRQSIERRLIHFKAREEQLVAGEIDCLQIEEIFEYIAGRAGARKQFFHGCSNTFSWNFSAEQRKILFRLLLMIEEEIRWRPDP